MTKLEKVIKGLECLAKQHGIVGVCEPENCPYGDLHTCANEIARDAIALLKAQEPVEPKKNDVEMCGLRTWDWACPVCNTILAYRDNYCSGCGRAVKWDG